MYLPLLEFYRTYKKHIHDMGIYITIYLVAYILDIIAVYGFGFNTPTLSLPVFGASFLFARQIIHLKRKEEEFSAFSHGPLYVLFLAFGTWVGYMLFLRLQKFPTIGF